MRTANAPEMTRSEGLFARPTHGMRRSRPTGRTVGAPESSRDDGQTAVAPAAM